MTRTTDRTRDRILDAGFQLFFREGYARVSMDMIAVQAGMTKRTLYNHFESKDELLGAVLESQSKRSISRFRDWVSATDDTIAGFIDQYFHKAYLWASSKRWRGSGFTRLSMELADLPGHPARRVAAQHKADLEQWIESEFRVRRSPDPMRDARTLSIIMEGAMVLALISGRRDYLLQARLAALRLFSEKRDDKMRSGEPAS